jgi:hypothetical protein
MQTTASAYGQGISSLVRRSSTFKNNYTSLFSEFDALIFMQVRSTIKKRKQHHPEFKANVTLGAIRLKCYTRYNSCGIQSRAYL